ncbi:dienelactone hydrolase family protein [Chamaesiphon minutus]|uniref:Dienelactone hydrolase-like enzyme n=1 Tax=Chamaesiphon minutus (strain ATCC 27169 / PCC 6605) TaxID=1173020 RepID=K9UJS2_CHAP6|nr:dienelactone hydrolase family protein [Chamaesiphon minutus]AFY94449.1 dienelactone hydrolase-like enzyme [Chamaesiphon minutus PCC 6605]
MVKLPVLTKQVALTKPPSGSIESQTSDIYGYLAMPSGAGHFPGIIVLQEIFGVNTHIQAVTERIASLGYVAIAPALFDRFAPGLELGYTSADIELGRSYAEKTSAPQLLADIQSAIDYLKTLPQVRPHFGCIGFCFGGHVAYLAATLPDISVTASFYGRGITTFTPGGGEPSVSQTTAIAGTIYMFFGMEDASIPPEHTAEIEFALTQHDIPHQIWQYPGAEHGFCCDLRASYNSTAAESAWQHVEELFDRLKI